MFRYSNVNPACWFLFTALLFVHVLIEFLLGGDNFHRKSGERNIPGGHFDWVEEKKKVKNTSKKCAFRKQCSKNVRFLSFLVSKWFSKNCLLRNFSKSLNEVSIFYAKTLQMTNYNATNLVELSKLSNSIIFTKLNNLFQTSDTDHNKILRYILYIKTLDISIYDHIWKLYLI